MLSQILMKGMMLMNLVLEVMDIFACSTIRKHRNVILHFGFSLDFSAAIPAGKIGNNQGNPTLDLLIQ